MLRYMKYAYAVYQEKSFTAAAKKLYISQPALSSTIRKLEQEVGYPIFARRGKTVTLTPPGEKYIRAVEAILQIQANLEQEIDDMQQLLRGQLTVGCSTLMASYVLPRVLKKFLGRYPQIRVELLVESSQSLSEKLEDGSVDMVIDNTLSTKPSLEYIPLFSEQILIGVPAAFSVNEQLKAMQLPPDIIKQKAYADVPRVPVSRFAEEPFILLKHGNKMRHISDAMFREQEIHPRAVFEFDQIFTAVSYMENGFGISLVTDTVVNYGGCENTLFYLPQTRFSQREVYAIYRKNKYLPRAGAEFIQNFKEALTH